MHKPGSSQIHEAQRSNTAPTIGLVFTNETKSIMVDQWAGVLDEAREQNVNLICLAGGVLNNPYTSDTQAGVLFDLVSDRRMDALIIWTGVLNWYISDAEMIRFCQKFARLPMVSVEATVSGIPNVLADSALGMRQLMEHLINSHGYRKIAFLRGPKGSEQIQLRYQSYVDTLASAGIAFDPKRVSDHSETWDGEAALNQLVEAHGMDFEALVCASGGMALTAMQALQARGKHVPRDVAVVGFDNMPEMQVTEPPLTTVIPPQYELGRQAVKLVLDQLAGKTLPMETSVPCQLALRQSCGCDLQSLAEVKTPTFALKQRFWQKAGLPLRITGMAGRADFISTALECLKTSTNVDSDWAGHLWDAFVANLDDPTSDRFRQTLAQGMKRLAETIEDGLAWQNVLSSLRAKVLSGLGDDMEKCLRAETLLQQGRMLAMDFALRQRDRGQLSAEDRAAALNAVSRSLISTFEVSQLLDALAEKLPSLGISSGYLALFENPDQPAVGARLVLAFNEQGRIALPEGGILYNPQDLLPPEIVPTSERYALITRALYFKNELIGFILFGAGLRELAIYETLRSQISSALKGALLFQQRNQLIEKVTRNADEMNKAADMLSTIIHHTDEAAQQVAIATVQVASAAQEQAASASEMSVSVDRMGETIDQVVAIATQGSQTMGQAAKVAHAGTSTIAASIESISGIKQKVDLSAEKINAMNKVSTRVGNIMGTIAEIAYQTNLLALNAAMEAARAGENGRGFAVVAEEVRKLAQDSATFTQEVNHLVKDIQQSTSQAVATMSDSTTQVAAGVSLAQEASQALQQIVIAVDAVTQQVDQISISMQDLTKHSRGLMPAIDQIANASQENSISAQTMSIAAQQTRAEMREISISAETLRSLAGSLNQLLESIN